MTQQPPPDYDTPLTDDERVAPFVCPACEHHERSHGTHHATCNVGGFLDPCGCAIRRDDIPGLVLRAARVFPPARPYCLRCEAPIYQDDEGVWRREATGSQVCPRNPAVDGHEPIPTTPIPSGTARNDGDPR